MSRRRNKRAEEEEEDRICELLRTNDPSLGHHLALREPRVVHCCPNFQEFISSLSANSSIRTVYVGELVVQTTNEHDLNLLIGSLGRISTLEGVEVALPHINERKRLTGTTLIRLLDGSDSGGAATTNHLKTIIMWPFLTMNSQEEIDSIADCLRRCHSNSSSSSLRQLALMNILLPTTAAATTRNNNENNDDNNEENNNTTTTTNDDNLPRCCYDPLLESLGTLPKLETLQMSAGIRLDVGRCPIGEEALANLVRTSPSLQSLAVRNFGLTDSHCINLCNSLMMTTTTDTTDQHNNTPSILPKKNLKTLDLRFNCITDTGYRAIRNMLDVNYHLEWIETDLTATTTTEEVENNNDMLLLKEINFLLLLNRAGRSTLFNKDPNHATKLQCVDVFSRTENNLDATYYLLRRYPSMCDR